MGTSECARATNIIILSNRERNRISTFLYVIGQNGCVALGAICIHVRQDSIDLQLIYLVYCASRAGTPSATLCLTAD